ncbi:OmpA family protein [Abyssibacter profundi]|uniref:OmpA-like domain-containing protein n=1 Tax=Abyssibacter profundi TaxID=2182787 RepID=A0A363UPI0_9GAMM|nr:OmpA family protein [Abyssibacter profundi]PWN57371.1 hypothetical protein DEH80_02415 [Abyssibacter profundi]
MKSLKALLALAAFGVASSAMAQNSDGRPYIYAGGVAVSPDDRDGQADESFGAMFGYGVPLVNHDLPFVGTNLDLEFSGFYNSLKTNTADDRDFQRGLLVNGIYRLSRQNMQDLFGFTPYLLAGVGYVGEEVANNSENYVSAELGAGVRSFLNDHGTAVRGDLRVQQVFDADFVDVRLNIGLEVPLSSKGVGDADGDGVNDTLDRCPNTPAGVAVTLEGCEADDDFDGVVNSIDQCPRTPNGVPVDATGCSADADLDGVLDAYDECPDSAPGAQVNARGCEGVQDADEDGVADSMDRCPGTGAGIVVDTEGCAIKQTFALEGVKFEFNSAKLTANAKIVLQDVIDTLSGQPSMQAQVAGHTDSKGLAAYNERLSEERAMSVKQFLVDNGIDADRLTVVGYGESKPIASNDTEEGREANRRVEFSVISE